MTDKTLDIIAERPKQFRIGSVWYNIEPPTLGVSILTKRMLDGLGVNYDYFGAAPELEAIRLIKVNREQVCRVIALNTLRGREQLFNQRTVAQKTKHIGNLSDEDICTLLLLIMSQDNIDDVARELGIEAENQRYRDAAKRVEAKRGKSSSVDFGGVSLYGSLLDVACQRYGWTVDYVLYGVSLANLQLMLSDSVRTLYMDDGDINDIKRYNGDDPNVWNKIKSMNWD